MLLYRFWQHQTGSGRITDHAGFDSLKSRFAWALEISNSNSNTSQTISAERIERSKLESEALKKFLKYFEDHSNKIQESFNNNVKVEVCGSSSTRPIIQGPSIPAETSIEKRVLKFI
jgi:undecaprenyl pyrophosphate synthase